MKDYSVLLPCGESTMIVIHDAFDKGYQQGYEDGRTALCDCKDNMEGEYNRGLNDAWEVIQNIAKDDTKDGYSYKMMMDIFGVYRTYDIVQKYAPQDAIRMIKEYEKQKQDAEIKVGDEVIDYQGYKGVITKSRKGDSEFVQWMRCDGHTYGCPEGSLVKTGRTFPQIAEVLNKMRGEE